MTALSKKALILEIAFLLVNFFLHGVMLFMDQPFRTFGLIFYDPFSMIFTFAFSRRAFGGSYLNFCFETNFLKEFTILKCF